MERIPPQNQEAEKSVLGAMLLDKSAISETITILNESDFYNPAHANIYKSIIELFNSNKPVDIVTVSAKGHDLEYLSELASNVPTTANAKHYAGLVKSRAIRREYIKAAQEIIDLSYTGEFDNIIDFKNDVMQKIDIEIKDLKKSESDIKQIGMKVFNSIEERYKNNNDNKLQYGFGWLDKKTGGAHNKDLTILAARPSVGKTAFAMQIALNMAEKQNNIAVFSLEMGSDQLVERMLSNYSKIDTQKIRFPKSMNDTDWTLLGQASNVMDLPIRIFDDVFKIEEIRSKCRDLKIKNQLDYVIIDYLQLCDTMKKVGSTNERVSHISRQSKLMAKELNVPICMLSQLSRANEHDNRRPKLTDLRDSGAIEQDADNVFFLHDANYGKYTDDQPLHSSIELIVAKQRNGDRDIFAEVKFYKKVQRFYDDRG
jgi:replicative DNA helicase